MDFKEMNIDDIIDYCVKHNQVDWLKRTSRRTVKGKDGKARKITFIEIKLAFVEEFMPDIKPKAKPKKPSMYDRIEAL